MKRKNRGDPNCPMARSVNVIGEWGSLMILREAFGGVTRLDEIPKAVADVAQPAHHAAEEPGGERRDGTPADRCRWKAQ
jgi:hypothetical protein